MNDVKSLQTALLICSFVYLISFWNYYMAGKHLPGDLARAQAAD